MPAIDRLPSHSFPSRLRFLHEDSTASLPVAIVAGCAAVLFLVFVIERALFVSLTYDEAATYAALYLDRLPFGVQFLGRHQPPPQHAVGAAVLFGRRRRRTGAASAERRRLRDLLVLRLANALAASSPDHCRCRVRPHQPELLSARILRAVPRVWPLVGLAHGEPVLSGEIRRRRHACSFARQRLAIACSWRCGRRGQFSVADRLSGVVGRLVPRARATAHVPQERSPCPRPYALYGPMSLGAARCHGSSSLSCSLRCARRRIRGCRRCFTSPCR